MNTVLKIVTSTLTPLSLLSIPHCAYAQATGPAQSAPAAACMAFTPSDSSDGTQIQIVVPADQETTFAGRGYADQACPDSADAIAAYRNEVCTVADNGDGAVIETFARIWHATPRELCDAVNAVLAS